VIGVESHPRVEYHRLVATPPELEGTVLRLAERLIQLLDEGSFTATYKYAVIVGLLDLSMELTSATGFPPDAITTRQLAEKIIELYWSHCAPYGERILRQSSVGTQAEVVKRIQAFRAQVPLDATGSASLARARALAGAEAYERLARFVEWKLVEMPLPKLQVLGGEEDRFVYDYGFPRHMESNKPLQPYWEGNPGTFDNRLLLRPGVGAALVALNGLMRPLVYRQWAMMVARMNDLEEAALERHLFGTDRQSLDPVRPALRDLQGGRCFYCDERLARAHHVDHFIPWARHPDDGIHNLVVADERCNLKKRDYFAAAEHLERWRERSVRQTADLSSIAQEKSWASGGDRTLGVARAIYLRMPDNVRLWHGGDDFVGIEHERPRIEAALALAA
jgi:5-methylcytosine-specific restriction endonuclease McrA